MRWDGEEEEEEALGQETDPSTTYHHGRDRGGYTGTGDWDMGEVISQDIQDMEGVYPTTPTCARDSPGFLDGGGLTPEQGSLQWDTPWGV